MVYNYPGTIVLSYLGGTFGNALASTIISTRTKQIQQPNGNTYHVNKWPIDPIDCSITYENIVRFNKPITPNDIIQLHCLNADLILYKFPESKNILLTCPLEDEYFGIQRQWLVNTPNIQIDIKNILSAWNWIEYNSRYYNLTGRNFNNSKLLCLDFKSVSENFDKIEDYINMSISIKSKDAYKKHLEKQMVVFYDKHPIFDFAWNVFTNVGPTAPIEDLAREFLK